jgi:hypothetical protein
MRYNERDLAIILAFLKSQINPHFSFKIDRTDCIRQLIEVAKNSNKDSRR